MDSGILQEEVCYFVFFLCPGGLCGVVCLCVLDLYICVCVYISGGSLLRDGRGLYLHGSGTGWTVRHARHGQRVAHLPLPHHASQRCVCVCVCSRPPLLSQVSRPGVRVWTKQRRRMDGKRKRQNPARLCLRSTSRMYVRVLPLKPASRLLLVSLICPSHVCFTCPVSCVSSSLTRPRRMPVLLLPLPLRPRTAKPMPPPLLLWPLPRNWYACVCVCVCVYTCSYRMPMWRETSTSWM
jgi:hypothetical protein